MSRMLIGVFTDRDHAENAVINLEDAGFDTKDISIVMRDQSEAKEISDTTGANVASGTVAGATTGGVLGGIAGLLIGIGAIAIPGVGAVLIGGPIAAALGLSGAAATTVSGAVTGAVAGGLVGALMSLGVPEEEARLYEERVRDGAILVALATPLGREKHALDILEEAGADQIRHIPITDRGVSREEVVERDYPRAAYYSDIKRGQAELEEEVPRGRKKSRRSD